MKIFQNPLYNEFTSWVLVHSHREFLFSTKRSYIFPYSLCGLPLFILGNIRKIIMVHFHYHTMWCMLSYIVRSIFKISTTFVEDWRLDFMFCRYIPHPACSRSKFLFLRVHIRDARFPNFWRCLRRYPRGVCSFFSIFLILIYPGHTMRALYEISLG